MCCGISAMRPARSSALSSRAGSVAIWRLRPLLGAERPLLRLVVVDLSRRRCGDRCRRCPSALLCWGCRRFILSRRLLQFEVALVDELTRLVVRELGHILRVLARFDPADRIEPWKIRLAVLARKRGKALNHLPHVGDVELLEQFFQTRDVPWHPVLCRRRTWGGGLFVALALEVHVLPFGFRDTVVGHLGEFIPRQTAQAEDPGHAVLHHVGVRRLLDRRAVDVAGWLEQDRKSTR